MNQKKKLKMQKKVRQIFENESSKKRSKKMFSGFYFLLFFWTLIGVSDVIYSYSFSAFPPYACVMLSCFLFIVYLDSISSSQNHFYKALSKEKIDFSIEYMKKNKEELKDMNINSCMDYVQNALLDKRVINDLEYFKKIEYIKEIFELTKGVNPPSTKEKIKLKEERLLAIKKEELFLQKEIDQLKEDKKSEHILNLYASENETAPLKYETLKID